MRMVYNIISYPLPHDSLPTMILTECVLVYMDPDKSRDVVDWFGQHFPTALFLNYEPVCMYVRTILLFLHQLPMVFHADPASG